LRLTPSPVYLFISQNTGGDAQSTDGAESSHMHNPWEENYERGYEWFLLSEAKKRNPNIKTYGLSWAYPEWVTCVPGTMEGCTDSIYTYPNQTARYITKWIGGAKNTYDVDIDYGEFLIIFGLCCYLLHTL
jgi:galactosylceramidase